MTQAERVARIAELLAGEREVERLMKEMKANLEALQKERYALGEQCEHTDAEGKNTWKGYGMYGSGCNICHASDL